MCSSEGRVTRLSRLSTVIVHSPADASKAESLRQELYRAHEIQAVAPLDVGESDLSPRCIVFLSKEQLSNPSHTAVSKFAGRGRDAVIVILDNSWDTPPDEWAQFLCLRHADEHLEGLCRILASIIRTPLIRPRPQDVTGYAAALRYFHGYLHIVLRNFHKQLKKLPSDVHESCAKKMLIICPANCECPPTMEVDGVIEFADMHITRNMTRAGQRYRDFSATVYRIKDIPHDRYFYFSGVFANSLATLSEICKSGLAGIDETRLSVESKRFFLHLQQLLQHGEAAEHFQGQHRLLYWRNNAETLDKFLLPIVKEEQRSGQGVCERQPHPDCVDPTDVNGGNVYDPNAYEIYSDPKGICLIINIAEFDDPAKLPTRIGAEPDEGQLQNIFGKWLKFKVELRRNLTESEFLYTLEEIRNLDHTPYHAFVCCVMSHGCLGHIYTADSRRVRIVKDIIESFGAERCPTLSGKPKIFFIQSCQVCSTRSVCSAGRDGLADVDECFPTPKPSTAESGAVESDADKCLNDAEDTTVLLPNELPDVFVSYSTLPGSESFRDEQKGTFYMQALTEELKKGGDLKNVLKLVAEHVKQKAAEESQVQVCQTPFFHIPCDAKSVFLCGKA